ncbi:acyl-CoA/acyl-ACP dehydrogenase [Streptacidiphilus sp. ASG 303]|uniref:acyl-CoA dehydrogenase family protein n=1 Tax=Streptacidiphilus sp. ASG 303 TaxID=2896847 RepID=UPI001E3E890F|nr:acyl-CoA dehydrogenase family protein [Streptacidiphilus sp. ASG 303]MCD0486222.1 acyl-CoA/acyl-ACP dehydrogenase [Streptacidiphilus sp. ASG 303]
MTAWQRTAPADTPADRGGTDPAARPAAYGGQGGDPHGGLHAGPHGGPAGSGAAGTGPEAHRRAVAAEFARMADEGRLDLPLPGGGRTRQRWRALTAVAERDLALARLAEGHTDALAILAELRAAGVPGVPEPAPGSRWGVWAAEPPGPGLRAVRGPDGGFLLSGPKPYCSGARVCTHALVTAREGEERRLFAVALDPATAAPVPDSWQSAGMAGSDTLDVAFASAPAVPVGPPGAYLERPGFHHGGVGVAACWYGGARAVARTLRDAAARRPPEPHALAHLGAVDAALEAVDALLDRAAAETDADPGDRAGGAALRALRVRSFTEAVASEVLHRTGRALGAGPLAHDPVHARTTADLTVYLRQHHGERDLAALGAAVADARRAAGEEDR